jgi:hypothetical protein
MLIDCFPAFNEISLAKFRIQYLSKYVSRTIIAESSLSHSGLAKPLHFSEALRDESFQNVEILEVDLSNIQGPWEREIYTREFLINYAAENFPNSYYVLSDLDEIPSLDQIDYFLADPNLYSFDTPVFYRFANWQLKEGKDWSFGVIGDRRLASLSNGGRKSRLPKLPCNEPGGHFSYLESENKQIMAKIQSFAHQELNFQEIYSEKTVAFANKYAVNHLGRLDARGFGLLDVIPRNNLTELQEAAYSYNSNWFNFLCVEKKFLLRIYASLILTSLRVDSRLRRKIYNIFVDTSDEGLMRKIFKIPLLTPTLWNFGVKPRISGFQKRINRTISWLSPKRR